MDLNINWNAISRDSLPMCNLLNEMREFCKTYCVCHLGGAYDTRNQSFCSQENHISLPTPSASEVSPYISLPEQDKKYSELFLEAEEGSPEVKTNQLLTSSEQTQQSSEELKNDPPTVREIRYRTNRSQRLDITDKLTVLRGLLLKTRVSSLRCSAKKTRYTKNKYLGRRSKYIGVTRNNIHWQALINVDHKKKYIGTFIDEIEAAKTYDLYALAMQGRRANLNFSYKPQKMIEIIDHYLANGRINLNN
ncbi:unnamed protein product [Moneuplotes crassus]|uniref:AP2/ERF domain-containing protein n=1 Tax=Euplotes crassus TaxID=5936 RepID=A0AAD1U5H8_EUPCR|nr:unnamed protein product [Moneuplotes crassus]